ncbi:MAG: Ca-activated chloride channel family protein, partial [Patiriisocius sp.]
MLSNFEFVHPQWFWLFLILPGVAFWYYYKRNQQTAALKISSIKGFKTPKNWLAKLRPLLFIFRMLALSAIIVALARPRTVDETTRTVSNKGIDIVMAIDVSASMLARDLKPNRLEALKNVAARFIKDRVTDRIGLVEYAGESFTKTPLTSDKNIVLTSLKSISYNTIIEGGTAIGSGLATAVNRLKESRAKSKVIILLTDGVNNTGFIDPKIASELATEFEIKVYTIGLGTNGMAQSPIGIRPDGKFQYGMQRVEIDETLLKEIADETGGKYFRATSNTRLEQIYTEINELEKTDI